MGRALTHCKGLVGVFLNSLGQPARPATIRTKSPVDRNSGESQKILIINLYCFRAVLPPAPSLNSVGPTKATFQHPHILQQQHKAHYLGKNPTTAVAPRPTPTGAPPTTPIGEEATNPPANRFGGQQIFQPPSVQGRIRLAENFPEVFVEHF